MAYEEIPKRFIISPATTDLAIAETWLRDAGHGAMDGVIAKELACAYEPGQRTMIKVKHLRTADCVVGGFRYENGGREVGSLLLGLNDAQGKLDHVGFTATIKQGTTKSTKRVEAPGGPGLTGKAPGGPSAGAPRKPANGALRPDSSLRCGSTMSAAIDFATERSWCAGARTRRRINARSSKSGLPTRIQRAFPRHLDSHLAAALSAPFDEHLSCLIFRARFLVSPSSSAPSDLRPLQLLGRTIHPIHCRIGDPQRHPAIGRSSLTRPPTVAMKLAENAPISSDMNAHRAT